MGRAVACWKRKRLSSTRERLMATIRTVIPTAKEVEVDGRHGRFPKTAHLLRHSDFQKVYKQGKRHFSGNMTVFYLVREGDPTQAKEACMGHLEGAVRVGFTVPKALGKSVDRNRIRRRMREAVRHHLELLEGVPAVDIVFNPKRAVKELEFLKVSEEVARAFEVVRKTVSRKQGSKPTAKPPAGEERKPV